MSIQILPATLALLLLLSSRPALAEDSSWPQLFGPDGSAMADSSQSLAGQTLSLNRLWESATPVPPGRTSDGRRAATNGDEPASAGFASPVLGGGMIFQFTYRPAGGVISRSSLQKMKLTEEQGMELLDKYTMANPDPILVTGPAKWQFEADDIVTAYDEKTGEVRWRRVFPLAGMNWNFFSKGGPALTPAYHQGRLYAVGSGGRVYCLDARTGETVWQGDIGARHQAMEALRTEAREHQRGALFNRDFLGAVAAADGVVLVNTQTRHKVVHPRENTDNWSFYYDVGNGIRAFDAATGKVFWERPNSAGPQQPALWRAPDGKAYALTADRAEPVACLDLRTGRELWRLPHGHEARSWSPMAVGSWLLVAMPKPEDAPKGTVPDLMCYRIDLQGATLAWTLKGDAAATVGNPLIVGDVVYLYDKNGKAVIARDAASGKEVARAPWAELNGEHDNAFLIAHGGKLFGSQGRATDDFLVCDLEPSRMGTPQVLEVDSTIGYLCPLLPAFSGDTLIVRTAANLSAFRLR